MYVHICICASVYFLTSANTCIHTVYMPYYTLFTSSTIPPLPQLMHINNEWDKEYREQKEAFHRYRVDAQEAQVENHAIIARLKEKVSSLEEERERMEDELIRHQRELHMIREKLALSESVKTGGATEEELALLRQQVCVHVCVCVCVCVHMCVCVLHMCVCVHVMDMLR